MTRVSWDAVPLPVRQFLETHGLDRDGLTIEDAGRPKYRLVPVVEDLPWNEDANRRRFELIDREIAGTITPEESLELERLQSRLERHVNRVAPLPWEALQAFEARLLRAVSPNGDNGAP